MTLSPEDTAYFFKDFPRSGSIVRFKVKTHHGMMTKMEGVGVVRTAWMGIEPMLTVEMDGELFHLAQDLDEWEVI